MLGILSNLLSLAFGTGLCYLLSTLSIDYIVASKYLPFPWGPLVIVADLAFIWGYIGYTGLFKTDLVHNSLLLFLGFRLPLWISEGWAWWLPFPFGGHQTESKEEQNIDVPEIIIPVGPQNIDVGINLTLLLAVTNPYKYQRVKKAFLEAIKNLSKDMLIESVANVSIEVLFKRLSGDKENGELSFPKELLKKLLSISKKRWGVEIFSVLLEDINLPDELKKELANIEIEKAQGEQHAIATNVLLSQAQKIVDASRDADGNPTIKLRQAITFYQQETGKINGFSFQGGDPLTNAAAILRTPKTGGPVNA